jgi:hypothetical protein
LISRKKAQKLNCIGQNVLRVVVRLECPPCAAGGPTRFHKLFPNGRALSNNARRTRFPEFGHRVERFLFGFSYFALFVLFAAMFFIS